MDLSNTTEGSQRVITVNEDRIDAAVALSFKEKMREATEDGPNVVILDLSNVQFVDSSGLGAIVASMKSMGPGRKLALANMTPTVEKVFRLTRMDSVFSIFSSLEEALSAQDA